MGTFRLTVMETNQPKFMYFVKNVGDFIIGTNEDSSEIVVSSDSAILKEDSESKKYN